MSLLLKLISIAEQRESEESVLALSAIINAIRREDQKLYLQISGPPQKRGLFAKLSPRWIQDVIHGSDQPNQKADETSSDDHSVIETEDLSRQRSGGDRHFVEPEHLPNADHTKPFFGKTADASRHFHLRRPISEI